MKFNHASILLWKISLIDVEYLSLELQVISLCQTGNEITPDILKNAGEYFFIS